MKSKQNVNNGRLTIPHKAFIGVNKTEKRKNKEKLKTIHIKISHNK